jgi:hypothetical protein
MTTASMTETTNPITALPARRLGRSIGAVAAGFVAVVILSLGTDQVLHTLGIYPPWGQVMRAQGLFLLALGYRTIFSIFGSYLAAALAPRNPMKHALALGWFGLVPSMGGVVAAMTKDLGPVWYPIAILVLALPCAWVGGALFRRVHRLG